MQPWDLSLTTAEAAAAATGGGEGGGGGERGEGGGSGGGGLSGQIPQSQTKLESNTTFTQLPQFRTSALKVLLTLELGTQLKDNFFRGISGKS